MMLNLIFSLRDDCVQKGNGNKMYFRNVYNTNKNASHPNEH